MDIINGVEESVLSPFTGEQNQGNCCGRVVALPTADQLREWGHHVSVFMVALSWVVMADGMGLFLPAFPVSVILSPIVIISGAALNIASSAAEKRLARNVSWMKTDEKVEKYYQAAFFLHAVAMVGFFISYCFSPEEKEHSQVPPFMGLVSLSCMAWLGLLENGVFPIHKRPRIRLHELIN